MQISQIFLTDSPDAEMPAYLKMAVNSVVRAFPHDKHVIYDKATMRQFIGAHFDNDVVWAYDKLVPYAYKADLARCCILKILGGWYIDIAVRMNLGPKLPDNVELMTFRDVALHTYVGWPCTGAVIYSKPNHPVFDVAINMIVQNCRDEFYGVTPLCPTGPSLFGRALAIHGSDRNVVFGDSLDLTPSHEKTNRAFVLKDGTILAWGKPVGGGQLDRLGAKGVNNYNELWNARQIYAK